MYKDNFRISTLDMYYTWTKNLRLEVRIRMHRWCILWYSNPLRKKYLLLLIIYICCFVSKLQQTKLKWKQIENSLHDDKRIVTQLYGL